MNNRKIISPCISICKTNPSTGFCFGCARNEEEKNDTYSVSLYYKQVLSIILAILLIAGSINYLKQFIKKYTEKKSITKFLGSFICLTIGGIVILELENL